MEFGWDRARLAVSPCWVFMPRKAYAAVRQQVQVEVTLFLPVGRLACSELSFTLDISSHKTNKIRHRDRDQIKDKKIKKCSIDQGSTNNHSNFLRQGMSGIE